MLHVTVSRAPEPRALGFDLESRPSAFWFGDKTTAQITAFGWKWVDEPQVNTMLLRANGRFELDTGKTIAAEKAYQVFAGELSSAGLVFGHNIRRFDLPLFQAGLLRLQLPPLPVLLTTDTLRDYPKKHDMAASLAAFADMYELDVAGKMGMSTVAWERANQLTPDGIVLARKRVASDVVLQEKLRDKLAALGILRNPKVWRP